MTDIIKEAEPDSGTLPARIKTGEVDMKKHINNFHDEMKDLAVHEHALLILYDEDVEIAGLTPKFEFLKFKLHNYWEFKFYQPGPLASGN